MGDTGAEELDLLEAAAVDGSLANVSLRVLFSEAVV